MQSKTKKKAAHNLASTKLTVGEVCERITEKTMPIVRHYLDEVCTPIKHSGAEYSPLNWDVELAMEMVTLCGAKILIEEIDRVKDEARRRHATVLKRRPRIEQVRKLSAALLREVADEVFNDPLWAEIRADKAKAADK